jgi:hypothetical protein
MKVPDRLLFGGLHSSPASVQPLCLTHFIVGSPAVRKIGMPVFIGFGGWETILPVF